jgi:hypothetical protein
MKKTILIALIISGTSAYAQKGSWYIGGGAGLSVNTREASSKTKGISGSLSPEVGKFVSDNIQVGLGINSTGHKTTSAGGSYEGYQLGGFVYSRYLFGDAAFKPFIGISAGYYAGKSQTPYESDKSRINAFGTSFNAGFAFSMTPRISIFGSVGVLGFTNTVTKQGDFKQVNNDLHLNVSTTGNRFTFGMYYTFKTRD